MINRRDPTRSAGLRRHGRALVNRRVHALHLRLRQGLSEQDVVGLRAQAATSPPLAFINWIESVSHKMARAESMIGLLIDQTLTTPMGWPRELIERAVEHGIELVEAELSTSLGRLDAGEVSRLHSHAATSEVRGIAGETERRLLRHVVRAIETKQSPEALMREVRATLEKITRLRLHLMINTGVVRAVNAGKLFAYASEGIDQVGIDPEWLPHTHQRDSAAGHPRADLVPLILDARSKKAKRRERVAKNKAKRVRRKRGVAEELLKEIAANAFGQQATGFAERVLEVIEEAEDPVTMVNVLTAGDDKVCQECEDIASDGPYELEEARDLIPAHPNCRCSFIPFGDKRFAPIEEQLEEWE